MHFASPKADASWSEKVFKLCKKNKQTWIIHGVAVKVAESHIVTIF